MKISTFKLITLLTSSTICISTFASVPPTAPVTGFARNFTTIDPITDAKITILENNQIVKTDNKGHFGPILWPVGKPITFVLEKIGYRTTQSATVTVPPEGLTTKYNNISIQPIDLLTFSLLSTVMGKQLDEKKCHVATTILGYHKTLEDLPQGEPDSTIILTSKITEIPFYFDIFKSGPMKDYPNPFTHGLTETTADGGVVLTNLEPRDEPYVMTAMKAGAEFTQASFICRKGVFINVSPPQGPMVIDPLTI